MLDFTQLFVHVDDFWHTFHPFFQHHPLEDSRRKRRREDELSTSEIMTLLIGFQTSGSAARPFQRG